MRIIISGGTGLIGTELTSKLLQQGHQVILLSRYPTQFKRGDLQGVRIEKWDAKTSAGWGHFADGADAVINLAGANLGARRWTAARKQEIIQSRVNAGKAIVEAVEAASHKPGLVIQSSGVDYYGIHGEEEIDENEPAGHGYLSEVTKLWEAATQPVEDLGVRRVVYRGAVVLTRKGGAFPRILLPFQLFAGGPLGSGQQWFSWIHIQDQIDGMIWLLNNPDAAGVYNFCAPEPIQNLVLARTIGRVMHRPSFIPVPAFVIRLIFGEMAITVLGGQRVFPRRLQNEGFKFTYPVIETALSNLVG